MDDDPLSERTRSTSTCLDTPADLEGYASEFNMKKFANSAEDLHQEIRERLNEAKIKIESKPFQKVLSNLFVIEEKWKNGETLKNESKYNC